jgi:hypothetical protein
LEGDAVKGPLGGDAVEGPLEGEFVVEEGLLEERSVLDKRPPEDHDGTTNSDCTIPASMIDKAAGMR